MTQTASIVDMLSAHIDSMHWIEKRAYLYDRGWVGQAIKDFGKERELVSPRNGLVYGEKAAIMEEMLLEFDGKPTARLGRCRDLRRGELPFVSTQ